MNEPTATRRRTAPALVLMGGLFLLGAQAALGAWPTGGGGTLDDEALRVVTAPSGNVYALGTFRGLATFGTHTENSAGSADLFVAKLDLSGNVIWLQRAGGATLDGAGDIVVDESENVYITGYFHGSADFGSAQLTVAADGLSDAFLAKLDTDGNWKWVRQIAGAGHDEGRALATIPGDDTTIPPTPGSVFVAGRYECDAVFSHPDPLDSSMVIEKANLDGDCTDNKPDLFVARANSDGQWIWAVDAGNGASGSDFAVALAADEQGVVIVGGQFADSITLGGLPTLNAQGPLNWTTSGSGGTDWTFSDISHSPSRSRFIQEEFPFPSSKDRRLEMASPVSIPAGATLEFWHRYQTQSEFGGGVLEYSTDSGLSWHDILDGDGAVPANGGRITQNGYVRDIPPFSLNPLAGRATWSGSSPGFVRTVVDLADFGGRSVKFRFRFGSVSLAPEGGWWVDDVKIAAGSTVVFEDDMEERRAFFLTKLVNTLSGSPSFVWAVPLDEDVSELADLALDSSQRVVLAATSVGRTCFGLCSGIHVDDAGAVVAQGTALSSGVAWNWARGITGATAGGVAIDETDDQVYFSGSFSGTVSAGGTELVSAGGTDLFVAKLGATGAWGGDDPEPIWTATRAGGSEDDRGFGVTVNAASLYVAGGFRGTAFFGDDPIDAAGGSDAVIANLDADTGLWFDTQLWSAGQAIPVPVGADVTSNAVTCRPEIFVDGAQVTNGIPRLFFWSYSQATGEGRLHAMQPADNVEIRWHREGDNCDLTKPGRKVSVGRTVWPQEICSPTSEGPCRQIHVAGAPVEVEVPGFALFAQVQLPDSQKSADAALNQGVFRATVPGFSVLLYFKGGQPDPLSFHALPEVVETVAYTDSRVFVDNASCTVGEKILPPPFHDQAGRTGFVLTERAFYDGVGANAVHNREARTGPIIPVNVVNINLSDGNDLMVIAWYRRTGAALRDPDVAQAVFWPEKSIRYDCRFPALTDRIVIASQLGSEVLGQPILDPAEFPSMQIYNQPDPSKPGFNPNDEHALFAPSNTGSGFDALFALRSDFALQPNHTDASEPYVLLKYQDPVTGEWRFKVYRVQATGAGFDSFRFSGTAGSPVFPPYPVSLLQACSETLVAGDAPATVPVFLSSSPFFQDYKNQVWGRSEGTGAVRYFYPMQPSFFYDLDNDLVGDDLNGNGTPGDEDGVCIPWLARLPESDGGTAAPDVPIDVTYELNWPSEVPILTIGETLLTPKRGLPDIFNQAAVEVVFDELQDDLLFEQNVFDPKKTLARLIDPLAPRTVMLGSLPSAIATRTDLATGKLVISGNADGTLKLPSELRSRITYDQLNQKLAFEGIFDEAGAGEPLLLLNVMTDRERRLLKRLDGGNGTEAEDSTGSLTCRFVAEACSWDEAVEALYNRSRNPNLVDGGGCTIDPDSEDFDCSPGDGNPDADLLVGLGQRGDFVLPASVVGFKPALTAGFAEGTGYVTLAFNNDPSLSPLPVSLNILRVDCLRQPEECSGADCNVLSTYQGEIDVIESDNVFDEQLTLRHSGDFAGASDEVDFEWFYHADEDGTPPTPLPDPEGGQLHGWLKFSPEGGSLGANAISIEGANLLTLSDNWFVVRYELPPAPGADGISGSGDDVPLCSAGFGLFTGQPGSTPREPRAMLAEGWIKRVIKGLNPFETRVKDFHATPTSTFASMLVQLGERYEGDIAFNPDPQNLNQVGLIEAYETVLRRGMTLSIDATPPVNFGPANNALLLVASRISDFYSLLGNEAFADALDPTVGITTTDLFFGFGSLAPTIFNFQNQVSSLLEEELELLRGRDASRGPVAARPVYNRLFWNFTTGQGEVAYALSYNISDQNFDGVLDELDAQILYPQGHGDAWGHYTTALTTYFKLLQHPFFTWIARPEAILVAGVPIQVDFLDERKFAQAAAARARTGSQIVDLTYRFNYVEDPAGQWQGYKDTDPDRAWGLSGWARRAGMGAYFDWVVGNSLLPDEDPNPEHVGIQRIDRTTVDELAEISTSYDEIQSQLDEADRGLNPLGLPKGVIPFDIDPARIDAGETHFEQILSRAELALDNAVDVWDFANELTRLLRFNQDTIEDLTVNTRSSEVDFQNQLIEIFGYPYEDDIGPGGTYPADYDGPDLYHYMVVEAPELEGTNLKLDDTTQCVPASSTDCAASLSQIGRLRNYTGVWERMPNGVNFIDISKDDVDVSCADNPFLPNCSLGEPAKDVLEVSYTTWQHPDFGIVFVRNKGWVGRRRATGKIQDALNETIQAQISLKKAIAEYNKLLEDINCAVDTLEASARIKNQELSIKNSSTARKAIWTTVNTYLESAFLVVRRVKALTEETFKDAETCIPKNVVAGVAAGGDIFSAVRCALDAGNTAVQLAFDTAGDALQLSQLAQAQTEELLGLSSALKFDVIEAGLEFFVEKGNIDAMVRQEPVLRAELFSRRQALEQAHQQYINALAEGQRVLSRLITFRKTTAAAVQEYRYEDLAFRIFRNDALQKYRAQFDLAARYTYLAAAAYDYETNLLNVDAQAGQEFLTDIVRERSIGQILSGEPVPGSRGLADPIGRMKANFDVLKGQMGFNNPQVENNRFSLRRELFRIQDGEEGDAAWRRVLQEHRVDDLWQVPEFRRFARPFAPEDLGPQPGIVIPFDTTVTFGLNFFGWPLGPGDSFYDASNFATRVRAVGVWLGGYGELPLANTPRVYAIPAGLDVMRAPSANDFKTRRWGVVDQLVPVPFPIGDADLSNPDWLPLADSLSGSFDTIRRFSSFRAFDFDEVLLDSQFTTDSRLIGRSVWNTKWVLIIPGGNLLFDADEGLDTFIFGSAVPDGGGERDGNGVDDILFFFKTYAYSGF